MFGKFNKSPLFSTFREKCFLALRLALESRSTKLAVQAVNGFQVTTGRFLNSYITFILFIPPFIYSCGRLFERRMETARIDREESYEVGNNWQSKETPTLVWGLRENLIQLNQMHTQEIKQLTVLIIQATVPPTWDVSKAPFSCLGNFFFFWRFFACILVLLDLSASLHAILFFTPPARIATHNLPIFFFRLTGHLKTDRLWC